MIIIKKQNNKKILANKSSLKKPKLVKIEKIKDESGNFENIYHYDIFVDIDKRNAIEKDLQTIEIEKLESTFEKINFREKIFDNIDTSNTKAINLVANNALKIKLHQSINKKTNLNIQKVGSISTDNIFDSKNISKLKSKMLGNKSESEVFGTVKRLALFQGEQSQTDRKNLMSKPQKRKDKIDNTEKFQTKYNKLVSAGIDPAVRLSKIVKDNSNQGLENKRKGRFTRLTRSKKETGIYSYLNNVIKDNNVTKSVKDNYSLRVVEKNARIGTVTQRVKFLESQLLQGANSEINLMAVVRDKTGVAIETIPIKIQHSKEKKVFKQPKIDFEIEANKTSSGQVILKITNNENVARHFNVYSRQLNEYLPQDKIDYELKVGNVNVPGKGSIMLFRKGYHFKSNRPVFFRVNVTYDQKEYSNARFASIESGRKLGSINYAGLSAIIQNERIAIQVRNIDSNVKKVELHRRDLSKKERNFKITKSYSDKPGRLLENNRGKIIKKSSFNNIFTFYDDDVEYDHTYEYKALLYDDNGNKQLSSTSAIENYTKAHGVIDMSVEKTVTSIRGNQKFLTLSGKVTRKINDADKIFQDLFGRYYDLFEEDLKKIKDLNAITINLLIELINRDNSDITRLSEVSVDSGGNFNTRITIQNNNNFAIKITPRLMPPAEILSKVNNNLPNLAAKNRFSPVSAFNTAAIKRSIQLSANQIVSSMGDKHSQRSSRVKGKILDQKTQLNKTSFDAYYDGNTGDVRYILEDNILNKNYELISVSLKNKNVKYLELDSEKNTKDNQKNINRKKEYYLSSFATEDKLKLIDYFIMLYEENGSTVIDGFAYNLPFNNTMSVNYLFKTPVLYGKINFYAQPILKNGKMQKPILIKTLYKDDEGIK
jgi:hypothetical protein